MKYSHSLTLSVLTLILPAVFALLLVIGPVDIALGEVISVLFGKSENPVYRIIILESRLPMAVAAILSGAALSVSGLMMQTVFRNPLAGPSVLGVSSGASLGVSLVMLAGSSGLLGGLCVNTLGIIGGAIIGSGAVIGILLLFSPLMKDTSMLLIVGLMLSYLTSSFVTLMNFFAPSDDVKSFAVWGMGSFMGLTSGDLPVFASVSLLLLMISFLSARFLNIMMLGDRYVSSLGHNVTVLRGILLTIAGLLTAVVSAYCGPVGFIGLVVPHLARMLMRTSNNRILLPSTMLIGSVLTGLCALMCVLPSGSGVLPVNAITPAIGVPVILYILLRRNRLFYFN